MSIQSGHFKGWGPNSNPGHMTPTSVFFVLLCSLSRLHCIWANINYFNFSDKNVIFCRRLVFKLCSIIQSHSFLKPEQFCFCVLIWFTLALKILFEQRMYYRHFLSHTTTLWQKTLRPQSSVYSFTQVNFKQLLYFIFWYLFDMCAKVRWTFSQDFKCKGSLF